MAFTFKEIPEEDLLVGVQLFTTLGVDLLEQTLGGYDKPFALWLDQQDITNASRPGTADFTWPAWMPYEADARLGVRYVLNCWTDSANSATVELQINTGSNSATGITRTSEGEEEILLEGANLDVTDATEETLELRAWVGGGDTIHVRQVDGPVCRWEQGA